MLRVRRRLWTPAHIRHLPTAYRFLKPPSPAFSTRDDASKIVENAPIELPPPPRSDDFASSVPSLEESTHVQLASSSSSEPYSLDSSPQTESLPHEPAPPMESLPHEPTPPPVQEPIPEPKDRSIKVGPSTTEELAKRLRLWSHLTKARVQERSNQWTTTALGRVSQLGGQLNQITGYEEIDALKRNVAAQEDRIQLARTTAREAKTIHAEAVAQRGQSQREVNDLLSRKSTWSDDDVGRFTRLVRQDHIYEQAEVRAKEAAAKAEDDVDKEFSALMRAILNRYHEEQVWSDKIRSASTYGSLAVLGLNVLVFVMATIFIEPWKRRRLAATFEKKVDDMDAKNSLIIGDGMAAIHDKLDKQEQALVQYAVSLAALAMPPPQAMSSSEGPEVLPNDSTSPSLLSSPKSQPSSSPEPDPLPLSPEPLPQPPVFHDSLTWRDQILSSWNEWRLLTNKQATTEHVLIVASTAAFVGGTAVGWVLRELRR